MLKCASCLRRGNTQGLSARRGKDSINHRPFTEVHRSARNGDQSKSELSTYYPPNQPCPRRCYALGQAIRAAIEAWWEPARIGVLASGGLSHFTIDEELDRCVLQACLDKDGETLCTLPLARLNGGNSEIRNWIATAGAAEALSLAWHDYVPCYRSPAGTGCGMGFAIWSNEIVP